MEFKKRLRRSECLLADAEDVFFSVGLLQLVKLGEDVGDVFAGVLTSQGDLAVLEGLLVVLEEGLAPPEVPYAVSD